MIKITPHSESVNLQDYLSIPNFIQDKNEGKSPCFRRQSSFHAESDWDVNSSECFDHLKNFESS